MVYNHYTKCQVCGNITRIRLQVGHLKQHPIVVTRGKCKTSLLGKAFFDQENLDVKLDFENADSIENHNLNAGDYFAECSGEFPEYLYRLRCELPKQTHTQPLTKRKRT